MSANTNSVRLQRVLRATPEEVYRACLEPQALLKWMAPYGFTAEIHHLEAVVGGTFKMSFTNFKTKSSHSFGGTYLELTPFERIRYTDKFDDENLPGEILVTITLRSVLCGTELEITQEGLPEAIPTEMCYLGWQESLAQLSRLLDPTIPDAA